MNFLKRVYNHSPLFFQNIEKLVYSKFKKPIWENPTFIKWYNFLEESQWWSREKLEEYQVRQLRKLLNHAYENVPYYRKVFDERGIKPKDIQSSNDLRKMPYLTKKIFRANFEALKAENFPKSKFQYTTTSGSAGIPFWFYQEKDVSQARELAFIFTQWKRVGFKPGDKSVILRGIFSQATKRKFWQHYPADKNLVLSSFHLTEDLLPKYIAKIREFGPNFIQTFPSAITILAKFMERNNIKPFSTVKALLCGSEGLYSWQRKLLEKVFNCRVYSWYGNTEQVALAGECEKSTCYHIFPEYAITEITKSAEIVGTGFNNYAMPFIRYKTGDLVVLENEKCSCGRNYSLIKDIKGRLQEFIVAKDNRLIFLGDMQIMNVFDNVKQFQFYQDKVGEVVFNIVRESSYTQKDTERIKKELYKRLGDQVKLEVCNVSHIPPTKSGKYKFLIQKLPNDYR